jgi:exonuclease VII small subunit
MDFECDICKEKLEIFGEIKKLKEDLEQIVFALGTELYKHNTQVVLERAKQRIEFLIKELNRKASHKPNSEKEN